MMHNRYAPVREDTHAINLLPEREHDVWPLAGQLQLLNTNKTVRITHDIDVFTSELQTVANKWHLQKFGTLSSICAAPPPVLTMVHTCVTDA